MKLFISILLVVVTSCKNGIPENQIRIAENIEIGKYASKIDSLTNESLIENYIQKKYVRLKNYELKAIKDFAKDIVVDTENEKIAKRLKINRSFYKSDFDKNGYTDLLLIGDNRMCDVGKDESCHFESFVLMNFENDSTNIINIVKEYGASIVPEIKKIDNQNLLIIHDSDKFDNGVKYRNGSIDTLLYKFDDFVEYNPTPEQYTIQKIEFSTGACYESCPIFSLSLFENVASIYFAEAFNFGNDSWPKNGEGTFKTIVEKDKWNTLVDILNYLDFKNLNDQYTVDWTDQHNAEFKIYYDDNQVKVIKDYGLIGTYGLQKIYKILFDLRTNQAWVPQ